MQPGYVYMDQEEVARVAAHLGMTANALKRKYRMRRDDGSDEWYIDALHGKGCPLLTRDGLCSVHPVKPKQCSSFPFWSEMLEDGSEWEAAKSFCPGLDAPWGELYDRGRIKAIQAGWLST